MAKWLWVLILLLIGMGAGVFLWGKFVSHARKGDAKTLEREIRAGLPTGSPISTVDEFLTKGGIAHSFDARSATVYAIIRNTKGSTVIVREDLALQFHFDASSRLKSIDAKVLYTGP